jgi:hypothetical protein
MRNFGLKVGVAGAVDNRICEFIADHPLVAAIVRQLLD